MGKCADMQNVWGEEPSAPHGYALYARINNICSSFQTILSGVPQDSVLGPIMFNFNINDLFLFIKQATLYHYADDNTPAFFSKIYSNLIGVLEREPGEALTWLEHNQMIANPEKFKVILLRKKQTNTTGKTLNIKGELLKSKEIVKLLGIYLDYKLNFEQHISEICWKAASKLNALKSLKRLIAL